MENHLKSQGESAQNTQDKTPDTLRKLEQLRENFPESRWISRVFEDVTAHGKREI